MRYFSTSLIGFFISCVLLGQCEKIIFDATEAAYLKSLFFRTLKPGEKSIPVKTDPDDEDFRRSKLERAGYQRLIRRDGELAACLEFLWRNGRTGLLGQNDSDQKYYALPRQSAGVLGTLYCVDQQRSLALAGESLAKLIPAALKVRNRRQLDAQSLIKISELLNQFMLPRKSPEGFKFARQLAEHDPAGWGTEFFYSFCEENPDDPIIKKILDADDARIAALKVRASSGISTTNAVNFHSGLLAQWYFSKQDADAIYHQLQTHPNNPPLYFEYLHRLHRDDLIDKYANTITNPISKSEIMRNIAIYKDGSYDRSALSSSNPVGCPAK